MIEGRPSLTAREVEEALISNTHLREGVKDCISELTSMGVRCVIISAGAEPLAWWIRERAKFHDWKANWFEIDGDGRLVPNYLRNVSYLKKERWLRSWMSAYGPSREEVVTVGDSCNDVGMFLEAGRSITFNPTDEYAAAMGEVVQSGNDLRECLGAIRSWI